MVSLDGYKLESSALQLAIQLGLVSTLPYLTQLIVESGVLKALFEFVRQIISGSVVFSIFRLQTTAYYYAMDVLYGGAGYMASGRGFTYGPSSFVQLYALYSRSHIYLGFDLGLLVVVVATTGSAGSRYGEMTWGIWLVVASLLASPFWFNPLSFNMRQVQKDWIRWRMWLGGEVNPCIGMSWRTWNR